mmetsp:Transcript_23845/g.52822  ORF Transcript_23845/g.52822 Transcript_23845/m.52822 type:complete len:586 (+) Transcript_23845:79-1836(+)
MHSHSGDLDGQAFGGEAERIGTRLDEATDEFLKETKDCQALQVPAGQDQLTALEFVSYLGINLILEPELAWIAREMLAAPMPPTAEMRVSQAGVCYFRDTENDYFTIEHPLTQRYLKVLERQRLDLLAIRTKPSVNGLLFGQPEMLFHQQFRNLQIPCQSCGVCQSTLKCNQCLMSFCQACFDVLHKKALGPRKNHTYLTTACGSLCSTCSVKKPQVFCGTCEDYFCFTCFEDMHRRGNRLQHKSMLVNVSDGEIIEPQKRDKLGNWVPNKCEECQDNVAAFACDYCLDNFCVTCFWKCHFNGQRRMHTASKMSVTPLCNQCESVRATVFCEQCQELMCTECFTMVHAKGNRMLHLFMDAMDLLLLLERLDPTFQEHLRRARPRVLWAISQLQGWTKGIDARRNFRMRRDIATQIQRRWRGAQTRRRLLGMLHMHKWRRRQVNNYFLPKTAAERSAVKQKVAAMMAAKDVTTRAANAGLHELRDTIMQSARADPLEDAERTRQTLEEGLHAETMAITGPASTGQSGFRGTQTRGPFASTFTSYENSTRFTGTGPVSTGREGADISSKDIRKAQDRTLRQITRLDG